MIRLNRLIIDLKSKKNINKLNKKIYRQNKLKYYTF